MFEDFTTIDFILSYPGMIITIILLTQGLKRLFDSFFDHHTQYLVLGLAVLFCTINAVLTGDFSTGINIFLTVLLWSVNAFIIWNAAMKSFEKLSGDGKNEAIVTVDIDADSGAYKEAFDVAVKLLDQAKVVKLKADKLPTLPSRE